MSPFVSPEPFLASHLFSLSLSLSISLSLSLSCSFLSFFLVFLFCFLLVHSFCLFIVFLSSLLLDEWKITTSKYSITFVVINPFSFLGFPVLLSLSNPFSYHCFFFFFLILSYDFCSTWVFLVSKQTSNPREGLQQNVFLFFSLCFAKCEKLSFFGGALSWLILVDAQKHYKNRYFSTFLKQKRQNMTISKRH